MRPLKASDLSAAVYQGPIEVLKPLNQANLGFNNRLATLSKRTKRMPWSCTQGSNAVGWVLFIFLAATLLNTVHSDGAHAAPKVGQDHCAAADAVTTELQAYAVLLAGDDGMCKARRRCIGLSQRENCRGHFGQVSSWCPRRAAPPRTRRRGSSRSSRGSRPRP